MNLQTFLGSVFGLNTEPFCFVILAVVDSGHRNLCIKAISVASAWRLELVSRQLNYDGENRGDW